MAGRGGGSLTQQVSRKSLCPTDSGHRGMGCYIGVMSWVRQKSFWQGPLCQGDGGLFGQHPCPPGVRVHARLCKRLEAPTGSSLPLRLACGRHLTHIPPSVRDLSLAGPASPPRLATAHRNILGTGHQRHCNVPSLIYQHLGSNASSPGA